MFPKESKRERDLDKSCIHLVLRSTKQTHPSLPQLRVGGQHQVLRSCDGRGLDWPTPWLHLVTCVSIAFIAAKHCGTLYVKCIASTIGGFLGGLKG